ncbi:MAG: peroxiredoxin, partial [Candidatus Rokuibacteriota bacterium]
MGCGLPRTPAPGPCQEPVPRDRAAIYFYPKDNTPGCTKEACGFRDLWKDLQKAGVASHAKFAAKYKLPFPGSVRQEDQGRDPLHRLDRPRRHGPQALGARGRRGQAPGPGPRADPSPGS